MNAKQAMKKAKKLAEQEAKMRMFPLYDFITEMDKLEWKEDDKPGKYLIEHWPYVKEELMEQKKDGGKLQMDAVKIRVPDGVSVHMKMLQVDFFNLMNEAEMFFVNAGRYEEGVPFFQDVLDLFDLSGERYRLTRDNYTSAIGAVYSIQGRKEECDRYFSDLLAGQERNDYVAARYATIMLNDMDLEKAETFLADYRDSKEEAMLDVFKRLEELKNTH